MSTQKNIVTKKDLIKIAVFTLLFIVSPVILLILDASLQYIHTAQALTDKKLSIYNECIELFSSYPQYNEIAIITHNHVKIDGNDFSMLDDMYFANKFKNRYPEIYGKEICKIKSLSKKLEEVGCFKAEKTHNIVLFYSIKRFLRFPSFGVIYSLNGGDPNLIDSKLLNKNKPFLRISGNWYASRNLYISWNRKSNEHELRALPNSLIDHSLVPAANSQ
jgi:hypothetical protein